MYSYNCEYAKRYIEGTLESPYTVYKNSTIAGIAADLGLSEIWDLGGNVSGLMKMDGSLRFQLEKLGVSYSAVDLTPEYFSANFARSLGQPEERIYQGVGGVVGDMRNLPLATGGVKG